MPEEKRLLTRFRHIVCATDGTDYARAAGEEAAALAQAYGARLTGIYVIDRHAATHLGIYYSRAIQEMTKEGERALEELRRIAEAAGDIPFQPFLIEGNPKTDIVETAHEQNADLIVVGSHGATGITRLLLGSVAEAVVRHARCSVLVVRRHSGDRP